jgi:hypothetical protein
VAIGFRVSARREHERSSHAGAWRIDRPAPSAQVVYRHDPAAT